MTRNVRIIREAIRDRADLITEKTQHREMTLEDILKLEAT